MEGEGEAGLTTTPAIAGTERELKLCEMWGHFHIMQHYKTPLKNSNVLSTSKKTQSEPQLSVKTND